MREFVTIDSAPEPVRIKRHRLQTMLQLINLGFVVVIISAWTFVALFVTEPIGWATWAPLSRGWRPGMLEYPFTLLWGLPVAGVAAAWLAQKNNFKALSYALLTFPILILGLIFGWYYLAPVEWH